MKISALTDIGKQRKENQDSFRAVQLADGNAWGLVCDGMGGVNGGRIAADTACETMQEFLQKKLPRLPKGEERKLLNQGLEQMNKAVMNRAKLDPELTGMGTTAVCAYVRGETAHIAHAGDSRAYLFRTNALVQLTHDHSMVQQLVDTGQITPQEAIAHPQKNLITKALGVDNMLAPDYTRCDMKPGDILLLCSDGLCNTVSDDSITDTLRKQPFWLAANELLQKALDGGGQDNITILLLGAETVEDKNG